VIKEKIPSRKTPTKRAVLKNERREKKENLKNKHDNQDYKEKSKIAKKTQEKNQLSE